MKCNECGSNVIREGDDLICENCGVVVGCPEEELVAQNPYARGSEDWRKLTSHEGRTSYSSIGKGLGDNGKIPHLHVHGVANKRHLEDKEVALGITLRQMRSLCERLNLPESVKEEAGRLLRQVKTFKGRSVENVMLCIVFFSAKTCHCPRSMYRVMSASGTKTDIKAIRKVSKWVRRELNIPLVINPPEEYVGQVYADLHDIDECVECGVRVIIEKLKGSVDGKNPLVTATAAFLIAMGIKHPYDYAKVEQVARAGGVSVTAIITRSEELRKM